MEERGGLDSLRIIWLHSDTGIFGNTFNDTSLTCLSIVLGSQPDADHQLTSHLQSLDPSHSLPCNPFAMMTSTAQCGPRGEQDRTAETKQRCVALSSGRTKGGVSAAWRTNGVGALRGSAERPSVRRVALPLLPCLVSSHVLSFCDGLISARGFGLACPQPIISPRPSITRDFT